MANPTDRTLLDVLNCGAVVFNQLRKSADGWQWWCQKDGPPNNRWVAEASLRDAIAALIDQKEVMDVGKGIPPAKK